jgi:DNA-directed RNA polymerase specialized sigma subunit
MISQSALDVLAQESKASATEKLIRGVLLLVSKDAGQVDEMVAAILSKVLLEADYDVRELSLTARKLVIARGLTTDQQTFAKRIKVRMAGSELKVFHLSYVQLKTRQEIAQLLNMSEPEAGRLLRLAILSLRNADTNPF